MERVAEVERKTKETNIRIRLKINGKGEHDISTGIPFFDHMLSLFAVHGFFDLSIYAKGDIEVDYHHTIEDVGLVLDADVACVLASDRDVRTETPVVTDEHVRTHTQVHAQGLVP